MKIFIAYKYTGENPIEVKRSIEKIASSLKKCNHEHYCTIFETAEHFSLPKKEIFAKAFKKIDESDVVLILLMSESRSEGLLIETGYSLAKNKNIILAIKSDVKNTHLRDLVNKVLEFKDIDDLCIKLEKLKI